MSLFFQHIQPCCKVAVVLVWLSLSSAVFGTFIGLAVAFTSLGVGVAVAGAGVAVIVAVVALSWRMFRDQPGSLSRRRASYTRLEGSDCACSASMADICYPCPHQTRGPATCEGGTGYQSLCQ